MGQFTVEFTDEQNARMLACFGTTENVVAFAAEAIRDQVAQFEVAQAQALADQSVVQAAAEAEARGPVLSLPVPEQVE